MKQVQKIRNNILTGRAVSVLGPATYSAYLARLLTSLPQIVREGDLRPLDKAMGRVARQFHYRGSSFFFDCAFCDAQLAEDSFAFGVVREIYIRDCYFKWQPAWAYDRARTVIDLGTNRGAFSTLMTTRADRILSVECNPQYLPIIRHHMALNKYSACTIENAFIGSGGAMESAVPHLSMDELFERHRLESVDFMKMDIEGSEFSLFESPDWLKRVRALSMEVHPSYGDPALLLARFREHGFTCVVADDNLQPLQDARQASFMYAWKNA